VSRFRLQAPLRAPAIAAALTAAGDVANATSGISTEFDPYYAGGWALSTSTANRTYSLPAKPAKATTIATAGLIDPISSARVYRATDFANEGLVSPTRLRHEYAKRQAHNYDNTRYLEQDTGGFWYIFNAQTFAKVSQTGSSGSVSGMAGDCEPFWHPTDPNKLWYTANNGGLIWYEYNLVSQTSSTLFTLAGKLPAGFTGASRSWTKGEGRPSNDGRYWWLMVETDSFTHLGMVCYDRQADSVIGHIVSSQRPDHCSISPLGNYCYSGYTSSPWATYYPPTYTGAVGGGTTLFNSVEHVDLAVGTDGTSEWIVYTDYSVSGYLIAKQMGGAGTSHQLVNLYPVGGEATAVHVSGLASIVQPGWVLISTYGSYSDYGATSPAPTCRWLYESAFWVRIGASPVPRVIANMHSRRYGADEGITYFAEPQASPNRDGTRILFASNWIGRAGTTDYVQPDDYLIGLPSWWAS